MARILEANKRLCAQTNFINATVLNYLTTDFSPSCTFIIYGHTLAGAYSDRAPGATAYPHRDQVVLLAASSAFPKVYVPKIVPEDYAIAYAQTDDFIRYVA
jgi:hypothetical protein